MRTPARPSRRAAARKVQPLVDAVWTHLGTFTHTEGHSKPELGVSVSGGGAVDRSHGSAT